ncbi:hypothetical protein B0T25DRAFT_366400 [Lasiosphaeria hispida]|uniref:Ankyrin repeat protein n=1 Tax=Lasiosphaeria hispida TaxID=260671 RepID=A0AAJ0H5H5_9PEZI|nr:hypothetical protein B0T25DRAFT_366400 [Lasiosphaeria hispida]
MGYVEDTAKRLLRDIKDSRQTIFQRSTPIVFIGYGFGGIVIQKAIGLAFQENGPKASGEVANDKSAEQEVKEGSGKMVGGKEKEVDPNPFPVGDIQQVLFLDTPFPKNDDFPDNTNIRMCQVLAEIDGREKGSKLVDKVWAGYQSEVKPVSKDVATSWLYSQARAKNDDGELIKAQPFPASHKYLIDFISVSVFKHRRLGRIPEQQDYVYQSIRSNMRSTLLFKAVQSQNIACAKAILEAKPLDILRDWNGRTPLHVACSMRPPKDVMVTKLVNERPNDTVAPDLIGARPLHYAVEMAWFAEPPAGNERSKHSSVIKYLMRNMQRADFDIKDELGRSPWDCLCNPKARCRYSCVPCAATWIRELRKNLELISGPAIDQDVDEQMKLEPPKAGSPQYLASFAAEGTVGEFYHSGRGKTEQRKVERINLNTASVYEIIYDDVLRSSTSLDRVKTRMEIFDIGGFTFRPTMSSGYPTSSYLWESAIGLWMTSDTTASRYTTATSIREQRSMSFRGFSDLLGRDPNFVTWANLPPINQLGKENTIALFVRMPSLFLVQA